MKRIALLPLLLGFLLLLGGCGAQYPTLAEDGTPWDQSWEMLGAVLGVEAPGNGFTLLENDVVLAGSDTFYAAWTAGESSPYVNADGRDVDLYPAQIYLLLYGCGDETLAREAAADFLERERESYEVTLEEMELVNGVEYTIIHYDCASESNPYARGISAFGVWKHYTVVAELTATPEYEGELRGPLMEFLEGCHYSAERLPGRRAAQS